MHDRNIVHNEKNAIIGSLQKMTINSKSEQGSAKIVQSSFPIFGWEKKEKNANN